MIPARPRSARATLERHTAELRRRIQEHVESLGADLTQFILAEAARATAQQERTLLAAVERIRRTLPQPGESVDPDWLARVQGELDRCVDRQRELASALQKAVRSSLERSQAGLRLVP